MNIDDAKNFMENYAWKVAEYNNTRCLSLSPQEVNDLDAMVKRTMNTNTNWYCATCVIERLSQMHNLANGELNK